MNTLFVHDHKFKEKDSAFFSSGSFPAAIWSRYLSVFDAVTVVGRNGGLLNKEDKGYTLSSSNNVSFKLLPDISNIKNLIFGNALFKKECETLVSGHDAVIARLPSRIGTLFVREAIKQGKPYAIEVVGCPFNSLWNYGSLKGKIAAPFAALSLKRTMAKTLYSIYVTENYLQQRYPSLKRNSEFCSDVEIEVVEQSVLESKINKFNNTGTTLNIGLIGNFFSNYKGIDVAIRSLAIVNQTMPNWKLEILGAGDAIKYLELARQLGVESKVNFLGSFPSGRKVFDWLDTIDLYLQPSLTEGLPRALIEAMSRGCPALASSVGGIPELLDYEYMVHPGDFKQLANKIVMLLEKKDLLVKISRDNYNKAKSYYRPVLEQRRSEFWLDFYKHVLFVKSKNIT